jgi:branched-chain amino acid aminotransferase
MALHGVKAIDALVLEEFDRAAPRGTGSAKVGGNYAPVFKWAQAAKAEGFEITLHLDSKTRSDIEEFSAAGFLGLKKDSGSFTLVAPNSESVIKSVTSESCLDLANSWGWNVEVRPVRLDYP